VDALASASTAWRSSALRSAGTATSTVTSRSPRPLPDGTPLPRTLNVRPDLVAAGTRRVTGGPSSVGTVIWAPSTPRGT
jgi:hypothetical protein